MNVTEKPARISHEGRVVLLALLAGLPGFRAPRWSCSWSADFTAPRCSGR